MNKIRNHPFLLTGSLLCLGFAAILLFVDPGKILGFIYVVFGICLVATGISKIYLSSKTNDDSFPVDGILNIVIGISIIFFHNFIVTIILGALFMVFPIIRIIKSNNKKLRFKKELPLLIIGLLIALSGNFVFWVLIKILGGLFVVLAIYLFVLIFTNKVSIINIYGTRKKVDRDDVIDADYEERD